jgi:uncharacterized membrane protein
MSQLVLATYASADSLERALELLRARGELDSVATVHVDLDGAYSLTLADRHASGEAFWGLFWEAFFGLVFRVPVPGTAYGSNLGGLFGAIDRAGLDAEFRADVRSALGDGSSGLAVIATTWNPEPLLNQNAAPPNTVLHASIRLEQDSELMHELGGAPPDSVDTGAHYLK